MKRLGALGITTFPPLHALNFFYWHTWESCLLIQQKVSINAKHSSQCYGGFKGTYISPTFLRACDLLATYLRLTCDLLATYLRLTCDLLATYLLLTCDLLATYLRLTCDLLATYLLLTCYLLATYLLLTCYLLATYLRLTCDLLATYLLTICNGNMNKIPGPPPDTVLRLEKPFL